MILSLDPEKIKDIIEYTKVAVSIVALGISIASFVISQTTKRQSRKVLTINEYHRIADNKGALHYFYHMSDEKYKTILSLAKKDHEKSRNNELFVELEDNLGKFDEFAAGINSRLYDYKIFKILAFNYCRNKIIPKLDGIMPTYKNDNSYANLKKLWRKMKKAKSKADAKDEKKKAKENA